MESAASIKRDNSATIYELSPGAQVRAERSGLLFYKRQGPRLYYLSSGAWISPDFFSSGLTLQEWLHGRDISTATFNALEKALAGLEAKGVIRAGDRSP